MLKDKWVRMYLDFAKRLSEESHAVRLKVGALFVSEDGVMSSGINGLPAGGSNKCETKNFLDNNTIELLTKPEVSHAEENLFGKLMRQGVSTKNGSLFLTHSPCINCSKTIVQAGIKTVFYIEDYRSLDGVDWLRQNKVEVIKRENNANL